MHSGSFHTVLLLGSWPPLLHWLPAEHRSHLKCSYSDQKTRSGFLWKEFPSPCFSLVVWLTDSFLFFYCAVYLCTVVSVKHFGALHSDNNQVPAGTWFGPEADDCLWPSGSKVLFWRPDFGALVVGGAWAAGNLCRWSDLRSRFLLFISLSVVRASVAASAKPNHVFSGYFTTEGLESGWRNILS